MKILRNNHARFTFSLTRGGKMIAIGAGKRARIPENEIESVKEQIAPFSFLSLEEESNPVRGAAVKPAQPEQGAENPVEPDAAKQQKKRTRPKKEAK